MTTPIYDFVARYSAGNPHRLHMPGHKGWAVLGCEGLDITEIDGADDLYAADGIILESEQNASELFGSRHSFYSCGGSSQSIKAMLQLALLHCGTNSTTILAGRNAHKAFLQGCALLDLQPVWLYPESDDSLCSCNISTEALAAALQRMSVLPVAVYITTPDYLGGMLDIASLAAVCHQFGVPLLVDNAHGAYLRFLPQSAHPLDLGADMCCDSAHKTLPVLTGGGYLHIGKSALAPYEENARTAMSLFGSSSPSYLILQSLDLCNRYLATDCAKALAQCVSDVALLGQNLSSLGLILRQSEPLKVVFDASATGATGDTFAARLRAQNIEPEYVDPDFVVLMFTPQTPVPAYAAVLQAFKGYQPAAPLPKSELSLCGAVQTMSVRQALLSPCENLPVAQAVGRVCAAAVVSCPPAIPIAISGEVITENACRLFLHYGIASVSVVK